MMRLLRTVLVAGLLSVSPASADVVELKTGQRVEGTLKQATPASVSVEIGGQVVTFEGDKVRAIYFGTGPATITPQPSLRSGALRALKAVQSATGGGVSYRDYAPRVTDAKIVVALASSLWNAGVTLNVDGLAPIARDPAVRDCAPAMRVIEADRQRYKNSRRDMAPDKSAALDGVALSSNVSTLWSCAADRISEAEKLLEAK